MTLKFKAKYILLVSFAFIGVAFSHDANAGTIIKAPAYLGLSNGLSAYWTFDAKDIGTNGTIAKDSTSNGRFGTITAAPPRQGKLGQALEFDGTTSNVAIVDGNPLNFVASGKYTISLWLKADDFEEWNSAFHTNLHIFESCGDALHVYAHTTTDATWGPVTAGITAGVQTDGGAGYTIRNSTDNVLTLGKWHHITVTYDGSLSQVDRINIYIDGVNVTDTSDNGTTGTVVNDSSTGTYIGRTFCTGEFFDGLIDDVRFYESLMSTEQIQRLYRIGSGSTANRSNTTSSLQNGLIGCWNFDGAYAKVPDCSGNGNTGTISGATRAQGKVGQALSFRYNNNTDYVNADSASILDNIQLISTCAWIYPKSYGQVDNDSGIIGKVNADGATGWFLMIGNDGAPGNTLYFYNNRYQQTGGWTIPSGSISLNSWNFVCVVYDSSLAGNDPIMYLNGNSLTVSRDNTPGGSQNSDGSNPVYIGNIPAGTYTGSFDGLIDEVRLYNRLLSSAEVSRLYNQTQSKFNSSKTDSLTNGLFGHWTFDGPDIGGSGTVAKDKMGRRNGSISGATVTQGKIGQALLFNGSHHVSLADYDVTEGMSGTTFTISAWTFFNSNDTDDSIFDKFSGAGARTYRFFNDSGSVAISVSGDCTSVATRYEGSTPTIGKWEHYVGVYDGATSTLLMYKDGEPTDGGLFGAAVPASLCDTGISTYIGRSSTVANREFDGKIDDVRFYNRALSASEIQKLYQMGR